MGFNISGIVINKNLENTVEELSNILNLEFDKEIDFEEASSNWKERGFIDVHFGENGTLIFSNEDLCFGDGYSYPNTNILIFAMSETSMVFHFNYSENQKIIRSKTEIPEEIIDEQGDKLPVEEEYDDISDVIFNQIEFVLGQSFWRLSLKKNL